MRNILIGFLLGLIVGAGLALAVAKRPDKPVPPKQATAPTKPKVPTYRAKLNQPKAAKDDDFDRETCRRTLAAVRAERKKALAAGEQNKELVDFLEDLVEKSGADSPSGNPMKFPKGLDPVFTPEKFTEAVDRLEKECPKVFPAQAKADCSEFPCVIQFPDDRSARDISFEDECPQAGDLFGQSYSSSSTQLGGKDDGTYLTQVLPTPRGQGVGDYMHDYESNLRKRFSYRFSEWSAKKARDKYEAKCTQDDDPAACRALGSALRRAYPDEGAQYTAKACQMGDANACNSLAWHRCHDQGNCDATAEQQARHAAQLAPTSGPILDTLAYVLCARGQTADANRTYQASCDAGYKKNCDKTCHK